MGTVGSQFSDATYKKLGVKNEQGSQDSSIQAAEALQSGYKINGTREGNKTIITYTFDANPVEGKTRQVDASNSPSEAQRELFLEATKEYSRVANIEFREAKDPEEANIKIFGVDFNGTSIDPQTGKPTTPAGSANYPINGKHSVISLDNRSQDPSTTSDGYFVALHEVGHALGLKHSFEPESKNARTVPKSLDQIGNTVMAYDDARTQMYDPAVHAAVTDRGNGIAPKTLMPLDIAAVQALYGANTDEKGKAVDKDFSGLQKDGPRTIYHPPGVHDTLDVSGVKDDSIVFLDYNLEPSRIGSENVSVAYGTKIDRVVAGKGNIVVDGSNVGGETMVGGTGLNVFHGNANNIMVAGPNGNTIDVGTGKNLIQENGGHDILEFGMGGRDTVRNLDASKTKLYVKARNIDRAELYQVGDKQELLFTSTDGKKLIVDLEKPQGTVSSVTLGDKHAEGNVEMPVENKGSVTPAQMHAIELGADIQNSGKVPPSKQQSAPPPPRKAVQTPGM